MAFLLIDESRWNRVNLIYRNIHVLFFRNVAKSSMAQHPIPFANLQSMKSSIGSCGSCSFGFPPISRLVAQQGLNTNSNYNPEITLFCVDMTFIAWKSNLLLFRLDNFYLLHSANEKGEQSLVSQNC